MTADSLSRFIHTFITTALAAVVLTPVQFNVVRDTLREPLQGPLPDKAGYWSRVLRFQLSL